MPKDYPTKPPPSSPGDTFRVWEPSLGQTRDSGFTEVLANTAKQAAIKHAQKTHGRSSFEEARPRSFVVERPKDGLVWETTLTPRVEVAWNCDAKVVQDKPLRLMAEAKERRGGYERPPPNVFVRVKNAPPPATAPETPR